MKKIFLLGSERSGSNLLRSLIGNHTHVSAPVAPHFCDVFLNTFYFYRGHDQKLNTSELLSDLEQYVNHPFNDWRIELNKQSVLTDFEPSTFIQFMNLMYSVKALSEQKRGYFSKDNHNHKYALGILKDYPEAEFIYLFRDPRDQVASWMRSPMHLHSPLRAAQKWQNDQMTCLRLADFFGVNIHFVSYEGLVDSTRETMNNMLDFLNLPHEEACYQTNKSNAEGGRTVLWENINKPIIKGNYKKYKNVLSDEDVAIIETICKAEMIQLGYKLDSDASYNFNSRLFSLKERIRINRSKKRSQIVRASDMTLFQEKKDFLKALFSKFER